MKSKSFQLLLLGLLAAGSILTLAPARGSTLAIERLAYFRFRGWDLQAVGGPDGQVVISGWFAQGTDVTWRSQLARFDRSGRMTQRILPPELDADPEPIRFQWTCRAVFSDGSLLVDSSSALGNTRLRLLPDGRIDNRSSGFHSGPVLVQAGGAIVIGRGAEHDQIQVGPFLRYVLRDGLPGERWADIDTTFVDDHRSDWTGETVCVQAAQAEDGKIWAWLRPFSFTNDPPVRLARFLPNGELDVSFQPQQPILATPGGPPDSLTFLLCPLAGGKLLIHETPRCDWRRINSDGSTDNQFQPPEPLHRIALPPAVLALPDGGLLVSSRKMVNDAVAIFELARVTPDGAMDPTFRTQLQLNYRIGSVHRLADGKLLLSEFQLDEAISSAPIVRLNPDGTIDPTFDLAPLAAGEAVRITAYGRGHDDNPFLNLERASALGPGKWNEKVWSVIQWRYSGSSAESGIVPAWLVPLSEDHSPTTFWRLRED